MGQIIYCSDLVLRIDSEEEVHNITEWLYESTDYRPINPNGCVIRDEVTTVGKLTVILVVWVALIVLTTFYCYFCEQKFFTNNKTQRLEESQYSSSSEGGIDGEIDETTKKHKEGKSTNLGNLLANMAATIPKDWRSRKERMTSSCSCNSIQSASSQESNNTSPKLGAYKRFWQSPSLLSPSDLSNDVSSSTGTESTIINDHVQTQDEQNHPILQLEMSPKMRRIPIQQSDFKSKLPWFAKLKSEVDIAALFLQIQRTKTLFIASKNNNKIAGKLDCWDCQILQFTSKRQF